MNEDGGPLGSGLDYGWLLDRDLLRRRSLSGTETLTAEQTWSELRAGGGRIVPEGSEVPLAASRHVVSPVIVVGLQAGVVCAWIEARSGAVTLSTSDVRTLEHGHVASCGRWHAYEPHTAADVRRLLDGTDVPLGALRFGQLLALRSVGRAGDIFEDRLPDLEPSMFADAVEVTQAPSGIRATLYPYQLSGWRWLRFLAAQGVGGLLGDEMGLGKTLQIIALLADPGRAVLVPALVIAPGTLLENWRRELARFAPQLKVHVHRGSDRTGRPAVLASYDVVLSSYDTVVRDLGLFCTVEWGAVIVDEAQAIRNPDAKRSTAVRALKRRCSIAVTGTPVENRLLDVWSIFAFAVPHYLGDRSDFDREFPDDQDGARRLEPLLTPLMLRRRVLEVAADLPPRIDVDVPLVMPAGAAALYERLRLDALERFGAVGAMVAMTRLRQFCGHPIVAGETWGDVDGFPKLARLLEIAGEIAESSDKAIVFASFTATIDILAERLGARLGAPVFILDGRTPIDDRQRALDAFSAVAGAAFAILNPRVGGAGLNITAASHVIHYGLEWNPALEAQASARAWRRGQTRPVTVHRMFFVGTLEEVMNERLAAKTALGEAAVIGVEGAEADYRDAMRALGMSPIDPGASVA